MINQWKNFGNLTCEIPHNATEGRGSPCYADGKAVLQMLNFDEDNFTRDILLLVALLVALRLLAFIALWIRARKR